MGFPSTVGIDGAFPAGRGEAGVGRLGTGAFWACGGACDANVKAGF